MAYWVRGLCHEARRDWAGAEREFRGALALAPQDGRALPALGHLFAVSGRSEEARGIVSQLESLHASGKQTAYAIALIQAGLGDAGEAFRWLKIAAADRDTSVPYLKVEQRMTSLHNRPEWAGLLTQLGLQARTAAKN